MSIVAFKDAILPPKIPQDALGKCSSLQKVLAKLVHLNPAFWTRQHQRSPHGFLMCFFPTEAKQVAWLAPIVRLLKKAIIPSADDLVGLPLEPMPVSFQLFNEVGRPYGYHHDIASLATVEAQSHELGAHCLKLMVTAPTDARSESTGYIFATVGLGQAAEVGATLLKEIPSEIMDTLLAGHTGPAVPPPSDPAMMARFVEEFSSKECRHCHAADCRLRCNNCGVFYYCNPVCQRADWDQGYHKELCKTYRMLKMAFAATAMNA